MKHFIIPLLSLGLFGLVLGCLQQVRSGPKVLYKIDSYFVSPDDTRRGSPFKIPADLVPMENNWKHLVNQANEELDHSPYEWKTSTPERNPSHTFDEDKFNRLLKLPVVHKLWPDPTFKSKLDREVDESIAKTMKSVDKELGRHNKLRPVPTRI